MEFEKVVEYLTSRLNNANCTNCQFGVTAYGDPACENCVKASINYNADKWQLSYEEAEHITRKIFAIVCGVDEDA